MADKQLEKEALELLERTSQIGSSKAVPKKTLERIAREMAAEAEKQQEAMQA